MIRHIFLDKTNTIMQGNKGNMGLNPILTLSYGENICRGILYFDEQKINKAIEGIEDKENITYTLKMTNCFSVDDVFDANNLYNGKLTDLERASSFDLVLFSLPCKFDEGRGYEYESDFYNVQGLAYNEDGSNWYKATNMNKWPENGVYKEIPEESIIATQHFDFGNEDLCMDITDFINGITYRNPNNGLGLAFCKELEEIKGDKRSVTFFTDHTNTFYHPYIEVKTKEVICDDRDSFVAGGKLNKLYLYAKINGEFQNLDRLPVCKVNNKSYTVKHQEKGVYYALISASTQEMGTNTIQYDMWSNLALNGEKIDDVEMEFVVLPQNKIYMVGNVNEYPNTFIPSICGINNDEVLNRGEIREVNVDFRQKYTTDKKVLINGAEYRIYVKDGNKEKDVIEFSKIDKAFLYNYFVIHTEDFIPGKYHIDIKVHSGKETKYYKDITTFNIK